MAIQIKTFTPSWMTHPARYAGAPGHDHPIDLAPADVDSRRPKRNEAVDFRSPINVAGRSDVEMEPVLADLRGPAPLAIN